MSILVGIITPTAPVVVPSIGWLQPLSTTPGTFRKKDGRGYLHPTGSFDFISQGEVGLVETYFRRDGLELPPQRPKRTPWQPYLFQSFTGDEPVNYAAAAQAGDGPTFFKTVLYQSRAYTPPDDQTGASVWVQYHNPLSLPNRRKPTLHPEAFRDFPIEVSDRIDWSARLALPPPPKSRRYPASFVMDPFPLAPPGSDYLWARHDGLELPPQRPKRTPWQPYHFFDPFPLPNVEPPFSQHVFSELSARIFRYRRRAELDSQVPSDPSEFQVVFDHITWWQPLTEPKRRGGPRVVDTLKAETHQPDPVVPFEWFEALREPKRRLPQIRAGAEPQWSFTHLETIVVMRWFTEMQRPVLPKDRRFHQDRYVLPPDQRVTFSWWMEANQPMRRYKPHPALQEWTMGAVITGTLHPLVFIDWFTAMAEPKRNKRTWDWFKGLEPFPWGGFIEKFGIPWYSAFKDPVRPLPQLGAELQPAENTMYVRGNLPFAQTGPLYINNRGGRSLGFWRGRTKT